MNKRLSRIIKNIAFGTGALVIALNAQSASATIMEYDFAGSDCSGFFGQGFDSCQIFIDSTGNQTTTLSPVIIKFDATLTVNSETEINSLYSMVTGSEFSFSTPGNTGTWSYIIDNPTGGAVFDPDVHDPAIKYWAAKASNNSTLFWQVLDTTPIGVCDPTAPFTIACLNEALPVSFGSWETFNNQGLSHLTFYDTEPPRTGDGPGPTPSPEPATMFLLGTGLIGVASAARRRKKK